MGVRYQLHIEEQAQMNFELLPILIYTAIFPIVIGLLLRVPRLVIEIKENRRWTFDWIGFAAIAVPCLYILTMSILPYFVHMPIPKIILVGGSPMITTVAGIVFGYVLLDSLKK